MRLIDWSWTHRKIPRGERPLLPRRAGALWEAPVRFGRNRESRSREAAGRRNWPEAVPKKMRGRKRKIGIDQFSRLRQIGNIGTIRREEKVVCLWEERR